jgi:hypothetical protein
VHPYQVTVRWTKGDGEQRWVRQADLGSNEIIYDIDSDPRSLLHSESANYLVDDSPEGLIVRHLRHPERGTLQDLSPCPSVGCDILGEEHTEEKKGPLRVEDTLFASELYNLGGGWKSSARLLP